MKLSDLFIGGQVNNGSPRVQQHQTAAAGAHPSQVGRQIRSLVPGQTIQGEVVARNGSEVQIKVSDDMVLNARVDQNMQLEMGKTMTFEVRNNGQSLTLSPLFSNTAADANVLKALDMASMPVNQTTVSMTGLMMEAGLPIDRTSLQQMFREVNAFHGADMSDIIDLHKLGLPVNEGNLAQIASYKNLTHQLVDGMNTVLGALPETMQGMFQEGNVEGAARMFQELLQLVRELPKGAPVSEGGAQALPDSVAEGSQAAAQGPGQLPVENGAGQNLSAENGAGQNISADAAKIVITEAAAEIADANTEALLSMADGKGGSAGDVGSVAGRLLSMAYGKGDSAGDVGSAAGRLLSMAYGKDSSAGDVGSVAGGLLSMADGKGGSAGDVGSAVGVLPAGLQGAVLAEAEAAVLSVEEGAAEAEGGSAAPVFHASLTQELAQLIRGSGADMGKYGALLQQLDAAVQNGGIVEQADVLQQMIRQGLADKDQPFLRGMISGKAVQNVLREGLSGLWTIEPEDVADGRKVDELYQRLDRQLKSLSHILERGGQTESAAFKAVSNMAQNLDFLQQLNQAYTYVQLPLRLQQGDAHGDLYVYTNKRSLAAKDGQISALLHLDMQYLGPVDVYVAMQAEKVNTRFYVQDDAMLDFLEQHMDLLTQRLQKRGYNCSFDMQVRDRDEEPESGLNGLMAKERGHSIAQYAFDVRA